MYQLLAIVSLLALGAGCAPSALPKTSNNGVTNVTPSVTLPIDDYVERRTVKSFGEYISDRFVGYHVGDDVEYEDVGEEVPVVAISDGTVERAEFVSGYGGFVLIDHGDVNALYGHLDLGSVTLEPGDTVIKGQMIGNLGDDRSPETDGERKHLHFGLYQGEPIKINGYERTAEEVSTWLNPTNYFAEHEVSMLTSPRRFDASERGANVFAIQFIIPENMEVEYVPSIEALNIFSLEGEGTARERSQIFIRYFDASEFLTLRTVTIHATADLTIANSYTAKRYDIEKKANVADFADQPEWRNGRHIVTDVRAEEGPTRYYVIAANPEFDEKIYEEVLNSLVILAD